jgi:hypothetical protein
MHERRPSHGIRQQTTQLPVSTMSMDDYYRSLTLSVSTCESPLLSRYTRSMHFYSTYYTYITYRSSFATARVLLPGLFSWILRTVGRPKQFPGKHCKGSQVHFTYETLKRDAMFCETFPDFYKKLYAVSMHPRRVCAGSSYLISTSYYWFEISSKAAIRFACLPMCKCCNLKAFYCSSYHRIKLLRYWNCLFP